MSSLFNFGFTSRTNKSKVEFSDSEASKVEEFTSEEPEGSKAGSSGESSRTVELGQYGETSAASSKSVSLGAEGLDLGSKDSGPKQPDLASYPQIKVGGKNRSFNKAWYNQFTWLEYSVSNDAAFCYSCRIFPSVLGHKERNFTENWVNQWKKAIEKFRKHSESESHKTSFSRWQHYLQSLTEGSISITSKISAHHSQEVKSNWAYLTQISQIIIFLARQGLALRGDNENVDSLNRGNFLELCSLIADVNPAFGERIKAMPLNATYLSAEIQNELLNATAEIIREQIAEEVNSAGLATIIVDESKDTSSKEQISICLRYADYKEAEGYILHEEFLDFHEADDLDAKSLSDQILREVGKLGLRNVDIVGQCYDGASVMSGHVNGVQARLKEHFPNAQYVHCHAHRLNLVLVDICKNVSSAGEFFVLLEALYVFMTRSLVHKVFVNFQQRDKARVKELVRLSDTRWVCRYQSLSTLRTRYRYVVEVLEYFCDSQDTKRDPKLVVEARGLLNQVMSVSFVTHLEVLMTLLSHSQALSETLQASDTNLGNAVTMINTVLSIVEETRASGWPDLVQGITQICEENNIPTMPQPKRRRKQREFEDSVLMSPTGHRNQPEGESSADILDDLRVNIFLPILDAFKSEMTRRFSVSNIAIMRGVDGLLSPSSVNFLKHDAVGPFVDLYADSLDVDNRLLKAEMAMARQIILNDNEQKDPDTSEPPGRNITHSFSSMEKLIPFANLPNLRKATQLALTLPVSSAVCERSFSAMKYIKNYLRSTMSNQRLSDLGVIYVSGGRSKELQKNPVEVVKKFSQREKRTRIQLF
ncbi:Zinc finger MYM-type protein 1 [Holothuria leucospilota]|uniref:Zinc finger MYM-type protein 1 n=1 Tax=Holothuria leucospilota TaxID=206669 RepID=A0A9Q1BJQ4_HOLLE|nr:Zinc finger MYM-type protein 1 [Holothuria leucospilota]